MNIYIAGKITGLSEREALAKFNKADDTITAKGHTVCNPMMLSHCHDRTWNSYMKECLRAMLKCDAVFALSDWEYSRGAAVEVKLAQEVGMPIYYSLEEL